MIRVHSRIVSVDAQEMVKRCGERRRRKEESIQLLVIPAHACTDSAVAGSKIYKGCAGRGTRNEIA
jgi:hypothetical protein